MADCSNTPTPESTANFDLDSRCFSEVMTSNADYTTAKASDGNVKKTFAAALREAGLEHVGEWSTNPLVTSSNQVIPYAGTNQLFRPLSLPYQVDSATNPNPNSLLPNPDTGYSGELVDVSNYVNDAEATKIASQEATKKVDENNSSTAESSYEISDRLVETRRVAVKYDDSNGYLHVSIVSEYISGSLTPFVTVWTLKDNEDGVWDVLSITSGESIQSDLVDNPIVIAGSGWVTGAPPNYYTTNVGDSYKVENVYCDTISVSHYADNRGGDFIAYLFDNEGNLINEKRYTTYRETAATRETVTLFEGLPLATYSVFVEFVGENKLHPPSGGTVRGWVHSTGGIRTYNSMDEFAPDPLTEAAIMSSSVFVYAISAKPNGSSASSSWVPVHSGKTGVSKNVATKTYVDGLIINGDLTLIPGEYTECKYLKIQQTYTAYNFSDQSVPMWKGQTSMSFTERGMVYDHTIEFLSDTFVSSGYISMLPARGDFFKSHRCIGARYGAENAVNTSGTSSSIPSMANSIFYGGEIKTGREVCLSLYNSKHANQVGSSNNYSPEYDASGLLTNRVDSISKFYTQACKPGSVIPSGTIWSASNYYDVTLLTFPMSGLSVF